KSTRYPDHRSAAVPPRRDAATGLPPRAANACRAAASLVVIAVEHLLDLFGAHRVEIVRYSDPRHEANPLRLAGGWRVERHDLDQRLAGLGDDERLALGGTVDQSRQMGLGFVHVDGAHLM